MVNRFFRKKQATRRYTKSPKTLKQILSDAFTKEVKKNPDLMRQLAFIEAGHGDLLEKESPVEKSKREIDEYVTGQALQEIKENPEIAEEFIQQKLMTVIGGNNKRKGGHDIEYFDNSPISSLKQALEDIDDLSQLNEKLVEIGISKSGNGGFLSGFTFKDLLDAAPHIAAMMGKGPPIDNGSQQEKTYIVRVNGADQELPESQYRQLVRTGKVRPVGEIAAPKVTQQPEQEQEEPAQEEPAVKELPEILKEVDFDRLAECMNDLSPQDFVDQLIREASEELEESRFLLGFFSTATYDNVVSLITPYKGNLEVDNLIDKILTDEGKIWLEEVIAIIQREEEEE